MTTGKNVLIAVGIILVGAAVVAANLWFRRTTALIGHDRSGSQPATSRRSCRRRERSSRSGSCNISAETPGRVVDLAVNEGRSREQGVSSCCRSIRARCARASTAATASLKAAEASLEQHAPVGRDRARAARAGAAEPGAPAGSLEAAAHDARSARQGRERRQVGASRRSRSARSRSARRKPASSRSAPASRAPATT